MQMHAEKVNAYAISELSISWDLANDQRLLLRKTDD